MFLLLSLSNENLLQESEWLVCGCGGRHHAVMMEVQMTGQAGGRPRPDTLVLCTKAVERLRPDLQHLFRHLSADPNSSIYAATHPKLLQRTAPPLMGVM
jgi:mediator of RNA polymerase II transcription subunit 23